MTLISNGDGTYSIKTYWGNYIRSVGPGFNAMVNQWSYIGVQEKWYFEPQYDGTYCIKNFKNGNYLRMYPNGRDQYGDVYEVNTQTYCSTDEKWTIVPNEALYVEIEYLIDQGKIMTQTPFALATQTLDNRGSGIEQTFTFALNAKTSATDSFSQSDGIKVAIGAKATAQIPFIGKTEISLSTEYSHSWTYGGSNTVEETWTASFPIRVPQGKVYEANASVKKAKMDIPYRGTVYFKDTASTAKVSGIYHGVDYYNLYYIVNDVTP